MISSISSSISAIKADILRTDVSAHNVANINTPGFAKTSVVQTSQNQETEISSMRKTLPPSKDLSATDFAEEAAELIKAKTDLAFNSKVIKTQDKMLGELLNITV
jgi:flagellar basal-body rod protein FlgC